MTVKGKLEQVSQLLKDWENVDNEDRERVAWKTGNEELREIHNEIVTVDLEILALEVSGVNKKFAW